MRRSCNLVLGAAQTETPSKKHAAVCTTVSAQSKTLRPERPHNPGSGSTLGKTQDRRRTTREALSMVGSWQKNADFSNDACQKLEIDIHRAAGDEDQLSTGIPPVADGAVVGIGKT